ncbi:MAG: YggS family pyridoxal phosphate-dependent enzyme [Anaerolinea sp.]|nr:YggS family pyridoxal phosphate-dependent enzyme [Anaerolinea sp.]MCC6973720.1 YggS family pyridoxal phosphate-dependent enzyme [Anaerolineae bacterium]
MSQTQYLTDLAARFGLVRTSISAACVGVHRSPKEVTLLAVSKTHPPEVVAAAVSCAQTHFGENRVEEGVRKISALKTLLGAGAETLTWHMIGHVQSRKARDVAQWFEVVHSVDSLKLAERLGRFRLENHPERPLRVMLEMNISGEQSKSGFDALGWQDQTEKRRSLWEAVRQMKDLPGLQLEGLMTMAPYGADPELTRPVFRGLRLLREALLNDLTGLHLPHLSMGMTDDYRVAIEEGATMVRIGRALFGERDEG